MADAWYFQKDLQMVGPVSLEVIRDGIAHGTISPAELVWSPELPGWTPADRVGPLADAVKNRAIPFVPDTSAPVPTEHIPLDPLVPYRLAPAPPPLEYAGTTFVTPVMLTPRSMEMLRSTQGWTRFMGILLIALTTMAVLAQVVMVGGVGLGRDGAVFLIVAFLGWLFYLIPAMHLVRYSNRVRELIASPREDRLEAALDSQRKFWKFVGIVTMIAISLPAVALILAALTAVLTR